MLAPVEADVAIVGYGPVGATLANLLGVGGLSVVIIERFAEPFALPRATHIDGEAMRVLQAAGIADEVAPTLGLHPRMQFVNAEGRLLIDWRRPTHAGPLGWRDNNRFHQPELEAILRRGVARFANHRTLVGCEFNEVREEQNVVVVRYTKIADGASGEVRARYLVGCDGANSSVRESIGSQLESLGSSDRWLVVDVQLNEPVASLVEGTVQICDPARPVTSIECVSGRHRWEIKVMPGDDIENFARPDSVWRMLEPWIQPHQARIERAALYTFRAVLAGGWRRGRVFLAGDAAHQTPPFLGQGLCAGVRDVANLAWKLCWVLQGRAPDSLLDSYEPEQSAQVRAFIREAIRIGSIIQVTDPGAAALRDEELSVRPQVLSSIRPSLGSGLHAHWPPPAGTLSKQPVLSDGRRLDDAAGQRFFVLGTRELLDGVCNATRDLWQRADALVLPDEAQAYLAELGCKALIVRPDRYILAAASTAAELDAASVLLPLSAPSSALAE